MDFRFFPNEIELDAWTIIIGLMGLMFIIQIFYFVFVYLRLAKYKEKQMGVHEGKPVSVVIAARNELKNLENNLPIILSQDYSEYQVVVVNDRSWDSSDDYLREMAEKHSHLHVITIQDSPLYQHGKKMAVTLGVKGAKHDILLFTDADCTPSSDQWVREMVRGYDSNEIVLGFSPYIKKKGILNWFIRFDGVQIALQYLSYALAGVPYMGVGRNMSYKKDLFYKSNGFKKHYHIQSGDDDLFVNSVANKDNVRIRLNNDAITCTQPKMTLKDWWWQKKRHFSSSGMYKMKHKILLSLYPISLLLMLALGLVSLFGVWKWVAISMIFLRITTQLLIFRPIYKKLGASELLVLTPIFELIFLIVNPMIHISNAFVKPNKWA